METYELANLTVSQQAFATAIAYTRAKLYIITEHGSKHWYIELDGITDDALLRRFAESEDIAVTLEATTAGGRKTSGRGYFHPNPAHRAAAIRGEGPLEGFGRPNGA
ncbi:hypothetical protein [Cohnella sp. GCM10027633]|uniref:hypothetical protein n=1 Tax=unclassified Cohnella TaxID=2636738 RepID=UPI00362BBD51